MGAHTARWNFMADIFRQHKYSSYALELKGYGATPDRPRGHIDSFDLYYRDILALKNIITSENPGKKVFILGESLGGLITFKVANHFDGQILISPAFANGMKFSISSYLTLVANILVNPKKTLIVPFTSAMCTRDLDYQQVMNNNPDESREASIKMLLNTLFAQMQAKKVAKELKTPSLFLISGKDYLIDERVGRKLFQTLPLKDKTLIEYPEMLHALSIDLGREKVATDVIDWTQKRL
jgi:alpha-beta hydrolase superfamily lysophospholipase